jgi:hypothetical protein
MASTNARSFRFLDLPAELRSQVYVELLCAFGEPIPGTGPGSLGFLAAVNHSIDPRVLCVSKQGYSEAYDVMLKRNRFILVRSETHLPTRALMHSRHIPIPMVMALENSVNDFKGYLLDVLLSSKVDLRQRTMHLPQHHLCAPCSIMILAKDLEPFCQSLECGDEQIEGFTSAVSITITVGPSLQTARPTFEASLNEFLNDATVGGLLLPFRTHIRGFKNVTIHDPGRPSLAVTVQREMAQDRWADPVEAIDHIINLKQRGHQMYTAGDLVDAHDHWSKVISTILRMRRGSSWQPLVARGDQDFVNKAAETWFRLCLNTAHVALTYWGSRLGHPGLSERDREVYTLMCKNPFERAGAFKFPESWRAGFTFPPSDEHLAKPCYRQAKCIRLMGNPQTIQDARMSIDATDEFAPNDSKIEEERRAIEQWETRTLA